MAPLIFDCEAVLKNSEMPPSDNLRPQDLLPRVYQEEYVTCVMHVSIVLMLCDGGVTACTLYIVDTRQITNAVQVHDFI